MFLFQGREGIALRLFLNFYLFLTWNRGTGRLPASGILNTGVQGIRIEGNKKKSDGDSLSGINGTARDVIEKEVWANQPGDTTGNRCTGTVVGTLDAL
jgi:hypothetical protein